MIKTRTWIAATVAAVVVGAFVSLAVAQNDLNPKNRKELKREDVAGTNMEIIISVVENQPGETISRHILGKKHFTCCKEQRSKHQTGNKSNCRPGQPL